MTRPETKKMDGNKPSNSFVRRRKETIASAAARVKEQKRAIKAIKETLKARGPDCAADVRKDRHGYHPRSSGPSWLFANTGRWQKERKRGAISGTDWPTGAVVETGLAPEEDER